MPPASADHLASPQVPALFRQELRALYDELDSEVQRLGPVCELSGRCCRFAEYGHTLFVSAPEFAVLRDEAPAPVRPIDDGATCPWQDAQGRCTARSARPLGCRVYYCQPSYQEPGQELCERVLRQLKALVDRHGLLWGYAPLHHHLRGAVEAGGLGSPDDAQAAEASVAGAGALPERAITDTRAAGQPSTGS